MTPTRKYSDLFFLDTFKKRYDYLRLKGKVGEETFGYERYLNQYLYHTSRWKRVRDEVIIRDNGCDLGCYGYDILDKIFIHHMNPITPEQIENDDDVLYDPEFLICTSFRTHNAIHYGDEKLLAGLPSERTLYDTCPWKKGAIV